VSLGKKLSDPTTTYMEAVQSQETERISAVEIVVSRLVEMASTIESSPPTD
jgi:hypothetical protein